MSLHHLAGDQLHLIVFGPGFGESIVLRVPPSTWIVVDGCRYGETVHPAKLLERHGAAWSAVILTHPHRDHASGLDRILEMAGDGLVGCADATVPDPAEWERAADLEEVQRNGVVEHVAAIQSRWEASPSSRWELRRNDTRRIGGARLTALHPDDASVAAWAASGGEPNEISSALLVEWHQVRLVLGSDLLAARWRDLAGGFPGLNLHAALKVPHHGSREAQHRSFGAGSADRLWIATPFSRGKKLPRFEDGQGVEWLLRRVARLHLTALPVAHHLQERVPFRATRQGLLERRSPRPRRRALGAGLAMAEASSPDPDLCCYVAAGFRQDGTIADLQHGAGAVVVTEGRHRRPTRRTAATTPGRR